MTDKPIPVPALTKTPLIDSHSHIEADDFDADRDAMIARMQAANVVAAVVVACDEEDVPRQEALLKAHPGVVFGAWGLHPEYEDKPETSVERIIEHCSRPGIVAVGETGLDYYWCQEPRDWQQKRFRMHIEAARTLQKPLIIHARDSEADALDILIDEHAGDMGFVMHCYSSDLETSLRVVDAGGLVSFTGSLTFKRNDALREVCRGLPLEKIMLETDSPYMAPVPVRGRRCEPTFIPYIAKVASEVYGVDIEEDARVTTSTAINFFRLPLALPV